MQVEDAERTNLAASFGCSPGRWPGSRALWLSAALGQVVAWESVTSSSKWTSSKWADWHRCAWSCSLVCRPGCRCNCRWAWSCSLCSRHRWRRRRTCRGAGLLNRCAVLSCRALSCGLCPLNKWTLPMAATSNDSVIEVGVGVTQMPIIVVSEIGRSGASPKLPPRQPFRPRCTTAAKPTG